MMSSRNPILSDLWRGLFLHLRNNDSARGGLGGGLKFAFLYFPLFLSVVSSTIYYCNGWLGSCVDLCYQGGPSGGRHAVTKLLQPPPPNCKATSLVILHGT